MFSFIIKKHGGAVPAQARASGPIRADWAFQEEGFLKRQTLKPW